MRLMIGPVCCCTVRNIYLDVNISHKLKKTKANSDSAAGTYISTVKGKTSIMFLWLDWLVMRKSRIACYSDCKQLFTALSIRKIQFPQTGRDKRPERVEDNQKSRATFYLQQVNTLYAVTDPSHQIEN